jgi:PTS system mannose-specific IID component
MLSRKASLTCFLRSYLLAAAFTPQGMQSLGITHALEPGLAEIYPEPEALRQVRQRYVRHFNTHSFAAPFLLGLFLHLEQLVARGLLSEEALHNIKDTAGYTLSAIGDSVFSGTLIPFWALISACFILLGLYWAAIVLTICLFAAFQGFRMASFYFALQHGLAALERLRRLNIINWGVRLKCCNALLLALFLGLTARLSDSPLIWGSFCVSLPIVGYFLVIKANMSRAVPICAIVLIYWMLA